MSRLDPGIHLSERSNRLDCRVKHGNDNGDRFASDNVRQRWMFHGNRLDHAYIDLMPAKLSTRIVKSRRPPPLLVCRKCLKRHPDGKVIKRALKNELKARAKLVSQGNGGKKTKRAKLVMTGCFGLCPKRAVVTATAKQLASGEVGVVKCST